jgi:hypothetical protein
LSIALSGWDGLTSDEDLGKSGAGGVERQGFQKLQGS